VSPFLDQEDSGSNPAENFFSLDFSEISEGITLILHAVKNKYISCSSSEIIEVSYKIPTDLSSLNIRLWTVKKWLAYNAK
jgi:hypothetical protein